VVCGRISVTVLAATPPLQWLLRSECPADDETLNLVGALEDLRDLGFTHSFLVVTGAERLLALEPQP
jgi:hypothetical protein